MRALAGVLVLAAFFSTSRAEAVELTWESPAGCPDRASLEQRIKKLLAGATEKSLVTAEGRITATKDGYHLSLTTTRDGTRGERSLDDPSCVALTDSAALIVAMAIDPAVALGIEEPPPPAPSASVAPSASAPAPPPVVASAKPVATAPPPVITPPPVKSSRPTFLIAARGDALARVFPGATFGASLSVGAIFGHLRLDLGGLYAPASEHELASPSGASASFELIAGQARGAWLWSRSGWELGPTAGFEAGRVRARGDGLPTSIDAHTRWLAASAGALLTVRVGRLAFSGDFALIVPFTRPKFVVEGSGTIHSTAALASRWGLSVEIRF